MDGIHKGITAEIQLKGTSDPDTWPTRRNQYTVVAIGLRSGIACSYVGYGFERRLYGNERELTTTINLRTRRSRNRNNCVV